jgi:DNA (cytosine-5)-methyltransferase 1
MSDALLEPFPAIGDDDPLTAPGPRAGSESSAIPTLSFFTGAGFLDLGFARSGFKIVWRNEVVSSFAEGFEYAFSHMPETKAHAHDTCLGSVTDLVPDRINKLAFGGVTPSRFGMIGGPPCPDFSVGGKNRGSLGERGQLSLTYVNRILELQPTWFLFENVPGLIRTTKHRAFFDVLRGRLEKKYSTSWRVLNALDLGVPQDRERLFMIGFRRTELKGSGELRHLAELDDWFPWPEDARYSGAKTRFSWPQTSPFGADPPRPKEVPEELMTGPLICDPGILDLPNSAEGFAPFSSRFSEVPEGDVSRKSFKRLHRWRYSPTAAYGNNEVHLHPVAPRRLTVREALRIQTVPDEYALPTAMPLSHKFKMIGNGVPVLLAERIADRVASVLDLC